MSLRFARESALLSADRLRGTSSGVRVAIAASVGVTSGVIASVLTIWQYAVLISWARVPTSDRGTVIDAEKLSTPVASKQVLLLLLLGLFTSTELSQ